VLSKGGGNRGGPLFLNMLTIMRSAIAAQRLGVFERYVDDIYRHSGRNRKSSSPATQARHPRMRSVFVCPTQSSRSPPF
jgi:alkylation response protein AidB-like acyl-CoA dehydrogenase